MTPAVEITDLFRVHQTAEGDAAALQGLSLTIREREVVTVLGPSGSGKSTLLRILAGLDRPSAGAVRVFGREIGKLPAGDVVRYRTQTVGYADQHYSRALSPELTARELVALELGLAGWTRPERERRADELLERVGLTDKRDASPPELSGGEQQRVAVAASIAHRPRLFLADEPTGELDAASATLVYATIGDLVRTERCTAVIVSHDPESASIADRIVRIRDGRVSEEIARGVDEDEAIVVGRGGWLRLPEDLLRRSGIRSHASARLDGRNIVVTAARANNAEAHVAPPTLDPPLATHLVAELRGVRKLYGRGATERAALDGVDATFSSSLLTAVTGPSGSGKTTLLQILAGLALPTSGEVLVLGTDLTTGPGERAGGGNALREPRASVRRGGRLRHTRSAADRAGGRNCRPQRRAAAGGRAQHRLMALVILGHGLEELPGDRPVRLDEWLEVPGRHAVAPQLRLGRDRRGPRAVCQQRDLTEVVSGPECPPLLPTDRDLRSAVLDHEEADPTLALGRDRVTRAKRTLLHRCADPLELTPVETLENRHSLEEIDRSPRHAVILSGH